MMNSFLAKPVVQNTLRYFFAYLLFALFAILGVEVIVNLHNAIYRVSLMATTRIGVGNVVYVWGGFLLFAVYAIAIAVMESLMNRAARTGRVLPVGVRIFAVEAGLALLAVILPRAAQLIFLPG